MDHSIVEYFSGHEGYACGYCGSKDTCYSHGLWAHTLTPMDYQNLIDRGWRRSGKYCYKPTMHLTCCPLYTIRCEAQKFVLTRSQKKVLKKVHHFLATGEKGKLYKSPSSSSISDNNIDGAHFPQDVDMQSLKRIKKVKTINPIDIKKDETDSFSNESDANEVPNECCDTSSSDLQPSTSSHSSLTHNEPDSVSKTRDSVRKPNCRKAKEIRKDRRLQKLMKMGMSAEAAAASFKKGENKVKSVEDFINDPLPLNPAHRLELRLVPADLESGHFMGTFEESLKIYKKYQMAIHKDTEEECNKETFENFLVEMPFENVFPSSEKTYGSFHHQYWLDDKLIAVGVLDILPYCLSSVYFFYDPEYSFLSLGTYAALREIALVRELTTKHQDLQYYYMGYYIHSCIKMRYKGQFVPSFLLCPETYTFQPIEKCRPKLDLAKYHRLEEDPKKVDTNGLVVMKEISILFDRTTMNYPLYKHLKKHATDEQQIREYAAFIGRKCYRKILLYRQ